MYVSADMYVCGYLIVPAKKYRLKTFFRVNLQKIIENLFKNFFLYLSTKKSEICIFCAI